MKKNCEIIICALCVAVLLLGVAGCHTKKKIAETRVEDVGPEPLPQPEPEPEPIPEPAIEPIVELVEDVLEQKAEEPQPQAWTPKYQTAYGKGTVTIFYKQQRLSSPVVITYIADSIIVASVQPLMGIEMYRLEAQRDKARLFEKLNRRYVEMTYEEISAQTKRNISFPLVEQMVEEVGLTYPLNQDTTLRYSGVEASMRLQYRTVNQPVQAFPISANGYSQTTIKGLLSK